MTKNFGRVLKKFVVKSVLIVRVLAEISPGFTANLLTNTIKPIETVTASIFQQETVNSLVKPVSQATTNAMHKIGDLQVKIAKKPLLLFFVKFAFRMKLQV